MAGKVSILIVDDEEVVRLSYLRILADACDLIKTATSGDEALLLMEQQRFDVVFLDLRMPGMDEISVLEGIKEKWPDCEVVVITCPCHTLTT
jgi:CheY-like chemotaxis protein